MSTLTSHVGVRQALPAATVVTSPAAIASYSRQWDALARSRGGAVATTETWGWIGASVIDPAPGHEPWLVVVESDGQLVGAAALIDDLTGTVRRTALAGSLEEHRGALLALNDTAAWTLGQAIADELMADLREFSIGAVPASVATAAMVGALPIGLVIDRIAVPVVDAQLPETGMSHGTARTLRKARNRLATDGLEAMVELTSDPQTALGMLPRLEMIYRERDIAAGRPCPLDDPARRRLWERRVRTVAAAGRLRVALLSIEGELAAYVLGIEEDGIFRVIEGRYVGSWSRYAPGRLLEAAVLDSVVASGRSLDWMTPIAPESLLAANSADDLITVRGRTVRNP